MTSKVSLATIKRLGQPWKLSANRLTIVSAGTCAGGEAVAVEFIDENARPRRTDCATA